MLTLGYKWDWEQQYQTGPGKLIVDGRYNLGLSNISDVKGENIKNRGFVFSLGYAIPIGK